MKKVMEWLLPERWRSRKEMPDERLVATFGRLPDSDPALMAITTKIGQIFYADAAESFDESLPEERRRLAWVRAGTLARLLQSIEEEREKCGEAVRREAQLASRETTAPG